MPNATGILTDEELDAMRAAYPGVQLAATPRPQPWKGKLLPEFPDPSRYAREGELPDGTIRTWSRGPYQIAPMRGYPEASARDAAGLKAKAQRP